MGLSRYGRVTPGEARAMLGGFGESEGFWRLLFWGVLTDLPTGLRHVRCPVVLAQGTEDLISSAQTPRYLLAIPGSTFTPLLGAGHAPQSDAPGWPTACRTHVRSRCRLREWVRPLR